jgi:hypothetical protein
MGQYILQMSVYGELSSYVRNKYWKPKFQYLCRDTHNKSRNVSHTFIIYVCHSHVFHVHIFSSADLTLQTDNTKGSAVITQSVQRLRHGLDDWGSRVRVPEEAGNFFLHHRIQNGSGAHTASYPMGTGGAFPGGKAAGAWSWPLTSI